MSSPVKSLACKKLRAEDLAEISDEELGGLGGKEDKEKVFTATGMRLLMEELRSDISGDFKNDLKEGLGDLRKDMCNEFTEIRNETKLEFEKVREENKIGEQQDEEQFKLLEERFSSVDKRPKKYGGDD